MQFELTIKGDSFDDLAALLSRNTTAAFIAAHLGADPQPEPEPETEEAPVVAKKSRSRKAAAPSAGTEAGSSNSPGTSSDAPPAAVTLDDLRAKTSEIMDSGKVTGKAIQEMLSTKFNAKAFGALDPSQYVDVLGELDNL